MLSERLLLIDKILCEGRLYRSSGGFHNFDGRDLADLLYLYTISLYMLYQDSAQHDFVLGYANKTTQYANYTLFRTHATDLYMLAYVINSPDNTNVRLRHHESSVKMLKTLYFSDRDHHNFVRLLSHDHMATGRADSFFVRLGHQLRLKNSRYHQWRREIVDWVNLRDKQKERIVHSLVQEFSRMNARGSEIFPVFKTMAKYQDFEVEAPPGDRKPHDGRKESTKTETKRNASDAAQYWSNSRESSR